MRGSGSLSLVGEDLDEVGLYLGGGDGGHLVYLDDDAAAAMTLHLEEDALDAVEGTAVHAHMGALVELYLVGLEVEDVFLGLLRHTDEVGHLPVGHGEELEAGALVPHDVLQQGVAEFEGLDVVARGVDEDEAGDGGHEVALFVAVVGTQGVAFGDEELESVGCAEGFLGLALLLVGTHHIPPHRAALYSLGGVGGGGVSGGRAHTSGSFKLL